MQYVQKKHPSYKEKKEESVMNFNQFNDYINEHVVQHKSISKDWVYNDFTVFLLHLVCLFACLFVCLFVFKSTYS